MHILLGAIVATALWAWAVAHQLLIAYIYAGLVERLPPPDSTTGKVYAYFYSVAQFSAANTKRLQDAVAVIHKPADSPSS